MKDHVLTVLLLVLALAGCQHQADPAPAPLEGQWNLTQYVITAFTRLVPQPPQTISAKPNIYLVISASTIEYHDPALTSPLPSPYTRQGTKLLVGQSPSPRQLQTITKLTDHELVLRVMLPGAIVGDSTSYEYYYAR
jgi:hypothetical protein